MIVVLLLLLLTITIAIYSKNKQSYTKNIREDLNLLVVVPKLISYSVNVFKKSVKLINELKKLQPEITYSQNRMKNIVNKIISKLENCKNGVTEMKNIYNKIIGIILPSLNNNYNDIIQLKNDFSDIASESVEDAIYIKNTVSKSFNKNYETILDTKYFIEKNFIGLNDSKLSEVKNIFLDLRDTSSYLLNRYNTILNHSKYVLEDLKEISKNFMNPLMNFRDKFKNYSSYVNPIIIFNANKDYIVESMNTLSLTVNNIKNMFSSFEALTQLIMNNNNNMNKGVSRIINIFGEIDEISSHYKKKIMDIKDESELLFNEYNKSVKNIRNHWPKIYRKIKNNIDIISLMTSNIKNGLNFEFGDLGNKFTKSLDIIKNMEEVPKCVNFLDIFTIINSKNIKNDLRKIGNVKGKMDGIRGKLMEFIDALKNKKAGHLEKCSIDADCGDDLWCPANPGKKCVYLYKDWAGTCYYQHVKLNNLPSSAIGDQLMGYNECKGGAFKKKGTCSYSKLCKRNGSSLF